MSRLDHEVIVCDAFRHELGRRGAHPSRPGVLRGRAERAVQDRRAEPREAPARVCHRGATDRGGVVRGHRLPHPHRAHHRRQAPGVRAAQRRARALDAGDRDEPPDAAGRHAFDGVRAVLRRGLTGVRERRRHRAGVLRRAVPHVRPRRRASTASRSPARGWRSGRPTTRASTTCSTATSRVAAGTCSPATMAASSSGRSNPRPIRSPPTARWASCSRRVRGARCAPRTCTSWSPPTASRN